MNHRDIDIRVAECLGWQVEKISHRYLRDEESRIWTIIPHFSTTGNGMLLLIEEARKQGVSLVNIPVFGEDYTAFAFEHNDFWDWIHDKGMVMPLSEVEAKTAPLAVALAYLKARGVDVTEYLEGIG